MRLSILTFLFLSELAAGDPARDAAWQQDLNYLAAQLPQRHPNFYTLVSQATFTQAVNSLANAIPNLNDAEVMVGMASIVALANDGHTNLFLTQKNSTFHILPIRVQWFEDGLFVIAASTDYSRTLGAKVLQIGDRSTNDAYAAIVPTISHENDIWVRAASPNYLVNTDILQALKIAPGNTSVTFEFQDLAGNQFSMDVAALSPGQTASLIPLPDSNAGFVPLYRQNTNQNYWFTYVPSSHLLYFAYNVCENMPGLPFSTFNDQLWATFDAQPVEKFVIDLRNNSGGDSSVLQPFFISGFERVTRFLSVRPYVIIGRSTYSSAILNAITLQQDPVKFVGEPTGGSPNSYGEVQSFTLPNSQLVVNYSTKYFSFPQYPPGSMLPQVVVPIYSADYFARHDPFLAAALADQAARPTLPQSATQVTVVNAADFRSDLPVAPGSLASAFGDFSGVASDDAAAVPLPTSIGGVQLLVDGAAASLVAVRPNQINFQVPPGTASGVHSFAVTNNGSTVAQGPALVAATAPGLFIADTTDTSRPAAALDEDSNPVSNGGVKPGTILQLFGTGQGLGAVPTQVFIGAEQADVLFSGMHPLFPGLWQINARVPDTAAVNGQVPIFVTAGSQPSNGVTVPVNR